MSNDRTYETIDCFVTTDGRTFQPRTKQATCARLPPDVYQVGTSMHGLFFSVQKPPSSPILQLDFEQNAVMSDVALFWDSAERYAEYGFPHKRGIMLYGPPGTGKTTAVRAIIGDTVRRSGIALIMGHPGAMEMALDMFRQVQPDTPVLVVMEEFDKYMGNFEESMVDLLDGLQRVDHILFLATTNHLKRIPEKLRARPSRFDVVKAIGYPGPDARRNYISGVLQATVTPAEVEGLVEQTDGMSIAHVKEVILRKKVYGMPDDILDLFRKQCVFPLEGYKDDQDGMIIN